MANFNSLELTPPVYPVSGVGLGGRVGKHARGQYTINAALAAGDTVQLFDLPPGARVIGGFVKSDKLDTGTALRIDVGIAGTPKLFFDASQAAGSAAAAVDRNMTAAGTDYTNGRARTRVFATVSTGPTTGNTTGTLVVSISYTVEEPA